MVVMVFTGAYVYLQWVKESCFGVAATTIQSAGENFGFEQKISSWSFTNNKIALSQLNNVTLKTYAYGQTRGSASFDFVLSSPWFLGLVGFKTATTTGSGPYVHVYALDTSSDVKNVKSFTMQLGQDSATDIVRTAVGTIVNTASISTSVGDLAKVSLDTNFANESLTTSLDSSPTSLSTCTAVPFTFAHGTLEFPDGVTITEVQDLDVTFSQNADHIWGVGSSVAASAVRKLFEITGKFKTSFTDSVQLQKLYAQQKDTLCNTAASAETLLAEQPTLTLTFTNGGSSTAERTIEIALTGISLADHSTSIEPNEPIFEDLNFQARGCTITCTNNTEIEPAAA